MQSTLNPDIAILPKGQWEFKEVPLQANPQLIDYKPGTWMKPESWMNPRILAIFSCPNCKAIRFLVKGIHEIDYIGKVSPDVTCKTTPSGHAAGGCSFHRRIYLDRWNKKPLYAVAIENWNGKTWTPEIRYTHADNETEARFMMGQGQFRIVAAGPAIGFFVEDKVGDKLNVSSN